MVTYNVETELDVANGVRGIIEKIIAHPEDDTFDAAACVCFNGPR